ncbi:MAG TPA: YidB family protein [Bryobacteraceae bacterium]|nr:YidB family protein [Bryobacteraceae bacterium]
MSLFDDVIGQFTGGATSGGGGQGLVPLVLELLSNRQGGISGLLQAFHQNGLGQIASSWIGTGENLPISAEQIQQVFGSEQIQAFAQKAGVAPEAASSQLAGVLPAIVDKLSPNGEVPQGDLTSTGLELLQGLFSKSTSAS